jgi:hypothetical protein
MIEVKIGERIEIVDVDGAEDVRRATVTRLISDKERAMGPEIEEYIGYLIEVALDGVTGDAAKQMVLFGTDSQYWMNGRQVLLHKCEPVG